MFWKFLNDFKVGHDEAKTGWIENEATNHFEERRVEEVGRKRFETLRLVAPETDADEVQHPNDDSTLAP